MCIFFSFFSVEFNFLPLYFTILYSKIQSTKNWKTLEHQRSSTLLTRAYTLTSIASNSLARHTIKLSLFYLVLIKFHCFSIHFCLKFLFNGGIIVLELLLARIFFILFSLLFVRKFLTLFKIFSSLLNLFVKSKTKRKWMLPRNLVCFFVRIVQIAH